MFRTTLSDSINSEETTFVVRHIHTYRKQKKKKQSRDLVDHGHESEGLVPEEASGDDGLLHDDEDIDGVGVVAEGARDEAVVVRVDDGGVEHPVHLDEPRLLVQLVLDLAPLGDLDHAVEDGGRVRADLQVVPRVRRHRPARDRGQDPLVQRRGLGLGGGRRPVAVGGRLLGGGGGGTCVRTRKT